MRKSLSKMLLFAAVAGATPATANVLFSDNFDSEGSGSSTEANYDSFANWFVAGNVDLVVSPDFGINCSGRCVDLDGSPGAGSIFSNFIPFVANELLTISFDVSGNQRSASPDYFGFLFQFDGPIDIRGAVSTGFDSFITGDFDDVEAGIYDEDIPGLRGFQTYRLSFTPSQAGLLRLGFGTESTDSLGPILDNVLVTQGAVPEPASWAMMIGGFALAGGALRRRRVTISYA